ncbi:MAG: hydroxymethylbilane synthase [Geminicoccaceae bacterium]
MTTSFRIATRASPLAMAQAELVAGSLADTHPGNATEMVVCTTKGDQILDRPLAEVGGKGLFTKEVENALLNGSADIAVHSCKDMATQLPDGLMIAAVLPREDPRDSLIGYGIRGLEDLPENARVGSASLRRRAQLLARRPDLDVVLMRGNVQRRLSKVASGEVRATLLALAGLNRLGLADEAALVLAPEIMLPAVGQGAIAVQCRTDDKRTRDALEALDHGESHVAVRAERAFLKRLDGSCRTPIAGHAVLVDKTLRFRGLIARPDGTGLREVSRDGPIDDPEGLGLDAGEALAPFMDKSYLESIR